MDKQSANQFLTAAEVAQLLHISKSHAYKVIHQLNQELKAQGVLTIAGRISRDWLMERMTGEPHGEKEQSNGSL